MLEYGPGEPMCCVGVVDLPRLLQPCVGVDLWPCYLGFPFLFASYSHRCSHLICEVLGRLSWLATGGNELCGCWVGQFVVSLWAHPFFFRNAHFLTSKH